MKNQFSSKVRIILFFTVPVFMLFSCRKNLTNEIDIKSLNWNLISISHNGSVKTENKDYFRENAYVLVFYTDTTFGFNTSVNFAGGSYISSGIGDIIISSFEEITKVGTTNDKEKELTEKLLEAMPLVERYDVLGKRLYLYTSEGEIKFKME